MIRERSAYYEKMIVNQGDSIQIFKEYIKNELIYFFKHKKRVQEDIQNHSHEYRIKFLVLAKLNEEFSFKLGYIDKILPLIHEQNYMMYTLLN